MDRDTRELWDVFECPRGGEEAECVSSSGPAERSVLVIWGGVVPGPETGVFGLGGVVVREVVVGQREEVRRDGVMVVVMQPLGGEWAGDKLSREGGGRGGWLHGVERSEVVPWWTVLISCGCGLGFLLSSFPAGEGGLGDTSDGGGGDSWDGEWQW